MPGATAIAPLSPPSATQRGPEHGPGLQQGGTVWGGAAGWVLPGGTLGWGAQAGPGAVAVSALVFLSWPGDSSAPRTRSGARSPPETPRAHGGHAAPSHPWHGSVGAWWGGLCAVMLWGGRVLAWPRGVPATVPGLGTPRKDGDESKVWGQGAGTTGDPRGPRDPRGQPGGCDPMGQPGPQGAVTPGDPRGQPGPHGTPGSLGTRSGVPGAALGCGSMGRVWGPPGSSGTLRGHVPGGCSPDGPPQAPRGQSGTLGDTHRGAAACPRPVPQEPCPAHGAGQGVPEGSRPCQGG